MTHFLLPDVKDEPCETLGLDYQKRLAKKRQLSIVLAPALD
jgi:hypothetical protein